MKGNKKIIERLNSLLADELAAINQYIVQSEMCENWGYKRLHDAIKKQAIEEMKHAERLIARILFLEGTPSVEKMNKINIGENLEKQFKNDSESESDAIKIYNESIQMAEEAGDRGTAEILHSNLLEEEKHLDWIETQAEQVKQMGLENYLTKQVG